MDYVSTANHILQQERPAPDIGVSDGGDSLATRLIMTDHRRKGSYAEQYARFNADMTKAVSPSYLQDSNILKQQDLGILSSPSNIRKESAEPVFKPGSIFYTKPDRIVEEQAEKQETTYIKFDPSSKNSIFFQDFSVLPSSHSVQEGSDESGKPSSKNSIFFETFSALPSTTRTITTSTSLSVSPAFNNLLLSSPRSNDGFLEDEEDETIRSIRTRPTTDSPVSNSPFNDKDPENFDERALVRGHSSTGRLLDLTPSGAIENDQIQLHYVPIFKNRLGEGRYGIVYRGYYSVDSPFDMMSPQMVSKLHRTESGNFSFTVEKESTLPTNPKYVSSNYQSNSNRGVCAVKCLHPGDSEAQSNGLAEATVLRTIQSWDSTKSSQKHIINLVSVKEEKFVDKKSKIDSSSIVLVLEYCAGGSLADYLLKHQEICGRRRWIEWCRQIATAVEHLHLGLVQNGTRTSVIHHDIKAHNVLLTEFLDTKLSDFGSAVLIQTDTNDDRPPYLKDGLGRGTQAYSPPEILTGPDFAYSFYTDIYALGCTFYFLLTGREPFGEVRGPAHQLWCIKKGFLDSGANPLMPVSAKITPTSANTNLKNSNVASLSLPVGLVVQTSLDQKPLLVAPKTSESQVSTAGFPLFQFLNGETLHSNVPVEVAAFDKIVALLRKCTATNPLDRPTATQVVRLLRDIDDLLVLGDGFDSSSEHSANKRTSFSSQGSHSSPTSVAPISTAASSTPNIKRVLGGRRAFF